MEGDNTENGDNEVNGDPDLEMLDKTENKDERMEKKGKKSKRKSKKKSRSKSKSKPKIRFRNYVPRDEYLREKYMVKPARIEAQSQAITEMTGVTAIREDKIDREWPLSEFGELLETCKVKQLSFDKNDQILIPKKPAWDLKRDIQDEMEYLDYLTKIALHKIVAKRKQAEEEKENESESESESSSSSSGSTDSGSDSRSESSRTSVLSASYTQANVDSHMGSNIDTNGSTQDTQTNKNDAI